MAALAQLILLSGDKEDYVCISHNLQVTMDAALNFMPLSSLVLPTSSTSLFPRPLIRKKAKHMPCVSQILDNADSSAFVNTSSKSVTRRLILLRHADSSWNNPSLRGNHIGDIACCSFSSTFLK